MTDYSAYVDYSAASPSMPTGVVIFYIAIMVVMFAAQWKVFTKAGQPGWACLIPFYNAYKLVEIVGMNGWMFLLMLVPIFNFFFALKVIFDLAKVFGKGFGFALGLLFFSPIFMCILGFGSAEYVGKE